MLFKITDSLFHLKGKMNIRYPKGKWPNFWSHKCSVTQKYTMQMLKDSEIWEFLPNLICPLGFVHLVLHNLWCVERKVHGHVIHVGEGKAVETLRQRCKQCRHELGSHRWRNIKEEKAGYHLQVTHIPGREFQPRNSESRW